MPRHQALRALARWPDWRPVVSSHIARPRTWGLRSCAWYRP